MKRNIFFIFMLLSLGLSAQEIPVAANLPIREKSPKKLFPISVEFPHEGARIPEGTKKTFIFGSIYDPKAKLLINNTPVEVYKNGAFLAYLPVEQGSFTFVLRTENAKEELMATRTVTILGSAAKTYTEAAFDKHTLTPKTDIWALPGDVISLYANATPKSIVTAQIAGLKNAKEIALVESDPGLYKGNYTVLEEDKARNAKITYRITHPQTNTSEKEAAQGELRILTPKDFEHARVTDFGTRVRTKPVTQGSLFPFYRMYGDVVINGRSNTMYRIKLNETESVWLEEGKLSINKKESPANEIDTITTTPSETKTRIVFYGNRIVPIITAHKDTSFDITFYYTRPGVPIIETPEGELVSDIAAEIVDDSTVTFKMNFKEGQILWGYDFNFDEHGNLALDLMHEPKLNPQPGKPLTGAKIMLDPGHSPRRKIDYDGAVGPTGYFEYEANMATAKELATLLQNAGAEVLMSKTETAQTTLQERTQEALKRGAHMFISIHHNALPYGANPFSGARGFTIYYFNEHSKKLAEEINKGFVKNVPLPNSGTLPGDFYVVRAPQFPAVLTENAFMMFPNQEEMVRNPDTRKNFVNAIYEGILTFYGVEIEKPKPVVKPAQPKQAQSKKANKSKQFKSQPKRTDVKTSAKPAAAQQAKTKTAAQPVAKEPAAVISALPEIKTEPKPQISTTAKESFYIPQTNAAISPADKNVFYPED